jgi:hypothetical protein
MYTNDWDDLTIGDVLSSFDEYDFFVVVGKRNGRLFVSRAFEVENSEKWTLVQRAQPKP